LDLAEADGGVTVSLRHVVPTKGLRDSQLRPVIRAIAEFSDSLEEQLTGQDRV